MVLHPDKRPAEPQFEPTHIDDHLFYDLEVKFIRSRISGQLIIRWYEDGEQKVSVSGEAVKLLDRRRAASK